MVMVLAGCATPPATGGQPQSALVPPSNPAVNATIAARQAQDAAATYDAAIAATQAVIQTTEQARVAATGTSEAIATGTAVAATSTAADLSVRATEIALVAVQTQNAIVAEGTATRQAAMVMAEMTAEAEHMQNVRMLREAEQNRLLAEQRRREMWNEAIPFAVGVFLIICMTTAGLFSYLMIRSRNPVYHVEHMGNRIAIVPDGRGGMSPLPMLAGNSMSTLALPAPQQPVVASGIEAPKRLPRASWTMFMRHADPDTVPIGVDIENQMPVFVNRSQNPHLLVAGTTGAGKTASGLVPFVAGNWRNSTHVVIINGRGSDFAPFANQPNLTVWPALRPLALIEPLAQFLDAVVSEMHRRDSVLARTGARNWSELPQAMGESGEILIAIDEFLTIVGAAKEAAELARLSGEHDTAKDLTFQATIMWLRLINITNEARKYGIFLAVSMTDPTKDAAGEHGMRLRRQMATIGFRMNSAAASRTFLDVGKQDGYASGSVGLPNGRFIYNINGRTGEAVGFYPGRGDVGALLDSTRVRPNELPDSLQGLVVPTPAIRVMSDRVQVQAGAPVVNLPPAPPVVQQPVQPQMTQAEMDGRRLLPYLREFRTVNAAGTFLSDESSERPSGQFLDGRLYPALEWLAQQGNTDADRLLKRRR
jgi:hypothetical protein